MGRWLTITFAALAGCMSLLGIYVAGYVCLGRCTDWRQLGRNYIEREYSVEWQSEIYRPVGRIEWRLRGFPVAVTYREPFDWEPEILKIDSPPLHRRADPDCLAIGIVTLMAYVMGYFISVRPMTTRPFLEVP